MLSSFVRPTLFEHWYSTAWVGKSTAWPLQQLVWKIYILYNKQKIYFEFWHFAKCQVLFPASTDKFKNLFRVVRHLNCPLLPFLGRPSFYRPSILLLTKQALCKTTHKLGSLHMCLTWRQDAFQHLTGICTFLVQNRQCFGMPKSRIISTLGCAAPLWIVLNNLTTALSCSWRSICDLPTLVKLKGDNRSFARIIKDFRQSCQPFCPLLRGAYLYSFQGRLPTMHGIRCSKKY